MTSLKRGFLLAVAVLSAFGILGFIVLNVQSGVNFGAGQYVLVTYAGYTYANWGSYTPKPGYRVLVLGVQVENHGYDSFPTGSQSGSNGTYYFHLTNGTQDFDPLYLSDMRDQLPLTDVLNGLLTTGNLAFAVPVHFGTYSLFYTPETGSYNIQFVNLGVTPVTETQTQSQTQTRAITQAITQAIETPGSQPGEQLILESYIWMTANTITFTLRNVGSSPVTIAAVYLGGIEQPVAANTISIGSTASYSVIVAGQFTMGTAYTLKVITETGSLFAFSVIAGSTG